MIDVGVAITSLQPWAKIVTGELGHYELQAMGKMPLWVLALADDSAGWTRENTCHSVQRARLPSPP